MPSFTFLARDAGTGREIRSALDAPSEQQAIASLLSRNLLVVEIQEKASRKGKAPKAARRGAAASPWRTSLFSPASSPR